MFFVDLMFALVLAIVLSLFVPGAFGWRRPGQEVLWDNMVFVFILFFLSPGQAEPGFRRSVLFGAVATGFLFCSRLYLQLCCFLLWFPHRLPAPSAGLSNKLSRR
jgi:hypothetical protein